MSVEIYEQRTVAFIDILGFKNALKNKSKARGILDALSNLKEKVEDYYSDQLREQYQGVFDIELTAFSDSIVISGSESQAIIVLFSVLEFSQLLLGKGFLCRGAMACGELYHKNGIVFGSGFVKVSKSEKSEAIYPRIVLDNRTVEKINESKNSLTDFEGLVKSDKDGSDFLNILYLIHESNKNLKGMLSDLVQKGLMENTDCRRIKQKLIWLQNEYSLQRGVS